MSRGRGRESPPMLARLARLTSTDPETRGHVPDRIPAPHARCNSQRMACQFVASGPNWKLAHGEVPLHVSCPCLLGRWYAEQFEAVVSSKPARNGQNVTTG